MKRVLLSIFVLLLVVTIDFAVFSLPIGDAPVYLLQWGVDPATKEALKMAYGYYDTLPVKYVKYVRNMFTFGLVFPYFGWSNLHNQYVAEGLAIRLPITLFLLGISLTGSIILGIAVGVFAASKRGTKTDAGLISFSLLTWGMPIMFIQLMAIAFFRKIYANFGIKVFATTWSTPMGTGGAKGLEWWAGMLSTLTLPILTLVLVGFGVWALYTRNMLVDALTQDFVVTARAKGLGERTVLYKHTFKSILPPIATLVAISVPALVTGSMITENVFGIDGIGRWFIMTFENPDIGKILVLDPAAASAIFFIFAIIVIVCNFIADLIYGILDPRIRLGIRK